MTESQKVKSFHQNRYMFCFVNDTLHVAFNDERSHHDWVLQENLVYDENQYRKIPRGYFTEKGNFYLYIDDDFRCLSEKEFKMDYVFKLIDYYMNTVSKKGTLIFYNGMNTGEAGTVWHPIKEICSITVK